MSTATSRPDETAWLLGTIGFSYADWSGPLYPRGVSGSARLSHYAHHFNAIEIDATFHAIPAPQTVRRWNEAVPDDFTFCLKTPRAITHSTDIAHLSRSSTRAHMQQFLSIASELGDKLSVVLLQFPRTFRADQHEELADFLGHLPDAHRYAVELRHDSWWIPRTAKHFRDLGVCWVAADEVQKHEANAPPAMYRPRSIVPTTDYLYVRWIGWHDQFPDLAREHLDPTARLAWWHQRLESVLSRRPELTCVLGFFGNGYSGYAPATCHQFANILGITPNDSSPPTPNPMPLFAPRDTDTNRT